MTELVITYNSDGDIIDWRYEADKNYASAEGEFIPEPEPDHRELDGKMVDLSGDSPELVDDPDYDPRTAGERAEDRLDDLSPDNPVRRQRISEQTKKEFRDARGADDLQTQVDILFEILAGEGP